MELLDFEKEIFTEFFSNDGLLVMAKGMRIEKILLSFIKLYSEPTNLVIVLNTTSYEEELIKSEISAKDVGILPQSITSVVNVNERENLYKGGGVKLVTNRIAIVDLLVGRLAAELITGIIIFRAHKMTSSCQESFIVRLYRHKNKKGFVKAMSCNAQALSRTSMQAVLKQLYTHHLLLWPRFRGAVVECFQKHNMDVIEMGVDMTKEMSECHCCLLDLIDACVSEVKKNNVLSEVDEINVEQALLRSFDHLLNRYLEPLWHRLPTRTKQLISDLRLLRSLLECLVEGDCVQFHNRVHHIKYDQQSVASNVGWLFTSAADRLYASAVARVRDEVEVAPKWKALEEIIKEVHQQTTSSLSDDQVVVLVLASSESVCSQLYQYMRNKEAFMRHLKNTITTKSSDAKKTISLNVDSPPEVTSLTLYNRIIIHFNILTNHYLDTTKPHVIILYHSLLTAVRHIEVYKHMRPSTKVYSMSYNDSTEQQVFLTSIKIEKLAFEKLIKQKATIVRTRYDDDDDDGDAEASVPQSKVIVDMREFRSELPSLLHKRGLIVEPVTLEVGDYILTPGICVERKSVLDLISSLQNGRLFNQCVSMMRFYKTSVLLIEFQAGKCFALQDKKQSKDEMYSSDITSRLSLLVLHFPRLKLLWTQSPHDSAQLFVEIKGGKEEPSGEEAASLGGDEWVMDEQSYNSAAYDMLLKMPGVTSRNVCRLMRSVSSLRELVELSEEELTQILDSKTNGQLLHAFIHTEPQSQSRKDAEALVPSKKKRFQLKTLSKN